MRVIEIQPLLQVVQRFVGLLFVAQQCQSSLDFCQPTGLSMPLVPGRRQFTDLVKLLRIQEMQGVVVIIILRPRDQLFQDHGTVGGQGKILDKFNFPAPTNRRDHHDKSSPRHGTAHL